MKYSRYRFFIVALFLCLSCPVWSFQTADDPIPLDPHVRLGKLRNGFTYYIRENENPSGKILIKLIVKAGYLNERADQIHVAHVVEHLAFQKTTHFPNVRAFLAGHGLRMGTDMNAATGFRTTTYLLSIPSSDPVFVRECIQLVRDWCDGLALEPAAIEAERGNVLNEVGNPSSDIRAIESINRVLLNNPTFDITLDSTVHSLKTFQASDLVNYYREWYKPNLQSIIVVGDLSANVMQELVVKTFRGLKRNKNEAIPVDFSKATISLGNFMIDSSWARPEVALELYYKRRSTVVKQLADYKEWAISELYNRMASERFGHLRCIGMIGAGSDYQRGVIKPDAAIDALLNVLVVRPGSSEESMEAAVKCFLLEERRIAEFGFEDGEIKIAKHSLIADHFSERRTSDELVRLYENHFLGRAPAPGDEYIARNIIPIITSITNEEIIQSIRRWQQSSPDIVFKSSKEFSAVVPGEHLLRQWINDVKNMEVTRETRAKLLTEIIPTSTRDSLHATTTVYGVGAVEGLKITTATFKNGVQVILKQLPADYGDEGDFVLEGFKPGGIRDVPPAEYYTSLYATAGILPSASTADTIEKYKRSKGVTVTPYIADDVVGFHGRAKQGGIRDMVELIYGYLTQPAMDEAAFFDFTTRLSSRKPALTSPYDSMLNTLRQVRRSIPASKSLLPQHPEQSLATFKTLFSDAKGFRFVITGVFQPDSVLKEVVPYFANLPSNAAGPWPVIKSGQTSAVECKRYESIVAKVRGARSINFDFFMQSSDDSPTAKMELAVLEQLLKTIMHEKLREEMGVTYAVGSFTERLKNEVNRVAISFSTISENVEGILEAVRKEILTLSTRGPEAQVFSLAVNQQRVLLRNAMNGHEFWQKYLFSQSVADKRFDEVSLWIAALDRITPEMIRDFAAQMLSCNEINELRVEQEPMSN